MKQIINRLRKIGLRQVVTVFLAAVTFLLVPAMSQSVAVQAQADTLRNPGEYNPVTTDTVKRIQEKAEDLGDAPDRPIGDTGLQNIKELPKKIPEVLNLKARQTAVTFDSNQADKKEAMDEAQAKVEKSKK